MLDRFFAENLFLFTHIPKCGGTSVDRAVMEMFGRPGYMRIDRARGRRESPGVMSAEALRQTRFVTGHFAFNDPELDHFGARRRLYFSVVRSPLARVVSFYKYMERKYRTSEAKKGRFFSRPANDVIPDLLSLQHPITGNHQCLYLGGMDFPSARGNILSNYRCVLPITEIPALIEIIQPFARPGRNPTNLLRNTTGDEDIFLSSKVVSQLIDRSFEDMKLFEWVAGNAASEIARAESVLQNLADDAGR